ncbi:short-chain dehydrogenase [Nocardia sp. 852002-20019_SCH5090214]|uniref:KR domain-containing protein n=1 Tax=Nocardia nova TaxID=37330 RepID=A0A2S6A5P6_9NOCA|nr:MULTISPECIES: SDR family NAD(P)-dependent oxidoreductase [Nocardia]OBF84256.1 short-chain dehydrogenase [Mycobacterium sp. 852002-51759_SCH5129042]MBF6275287.1 SDR family NAD(P)-dependent oxidoreductase [Nocardia nova]OBA49976.1 short-chain dehydrogenase [Nocardia sp. 852002-51101_SCH5132738]OBA66536.1 short-chain dehydrogenase [Nocardia sp. 852002-20019_SCH5090214]OBB34344.1 short-chain dehydrogenase [Nocardia sp. 852002-51244_SCH5132740]
MDTVAGKRVLITGAAMGLGKSFAQRAVREQAADVVLWDVNETALKQTAAELSSGSVSRVHHYVVDVSDQQSIIDAAAAVRSEVGDIDVLVNNAGIVRGNGYFWETENRADIDKTMAINSLAPMYIALEFLPAMVQRKTPARVLNIASSAALVSNPRMSVYAASKWAALGWSDSVRLELEQSGNEHVKVTTVCPTYINTGMFNGAKGFWFTPILEQEEVVDTAWREMKNGAALVVLPWTSRLNRAISGLLPLKVRDFYLNKVGVYHSMDEFTGRKS